MSKRRKNYLNGVLAGHQVDDFESVLDDLDGLDLFTSVATLVHEAVHHALDDGALDFSELLELVSSSSVGHGHLGFVGRHSDVIFEADIVNLKLLILTVNKGVPGLRSNPIFRKVSWRSCFPFPNLLDL